MKRLLVTLILLGIIFLLGQNVYTEFTNDMPAALILSGISGTQTEAKIIQHFIDRIGVPQGSKIDFKDFHLNTQYVDINNDDRKDIVAVLKSDISCGNAGCMSSIFLQSETGSFDAIENFFYTIQTIEVLDTYTQNMRDLRINNDTTSRLLWDGTGYILERI